MSGIIRIQKKFEKDVLCTNEAHTFVVKSNDAAFETKQFFIELLDRKTFVSNISLKNVSHFLSLLVSAILLHSLNISVDFKHFDL